MAENGDEVDHPEELLFDWSAGSSSSPRECGVELVDVTLREGLQSPSVREPPVEAKRSLLHAMHAVGIAVVELGLPGSSRRSLEDCVDLAREVARARLSPALACAARADRDDVRAVAEVCQKSGTPVEACIFVPASRLRHRVEGWDAAAVELRLRSALGFAAREGLPTTFVAEDATRAHPAALTPLLEIASACGARRVCIADTAGAADAPGTQTIVRFVRESLASTGRPLPVDWHGHNDRGLALSNALAATEVGVARVHVTALGVGERAGNVPTEPMLLHLIRRGDLPGDRIGAVARYAELAASSLGWPVPPNYPLLGCDVFRTVAGVHASAILKALPLGIADSVYSSVPAVAVGRRQEISVGPTSGQSNVVHWLTAKGLEPTSERISLLLGKAKESRTVLSDAEMISAIGAFSDPKG